jgi:hypothetical protein
MSSSRTANYFAATASTNCRRNHGKGNATGVAEFTIPKMAAFQGLFPGEVPIELQDLSQIETSLISLFSPATTLTLNSGKYDHTEPKTFTLITSMSEIITKLPNMAALNSYALLRHKSATIVTRDFEYRPNIVKRALIWLKENNHLYKEVDIVFPDDWSNDDTQSCALATIDLTEEDLGIQPETALPGVFGTAVSPSCSDELHTELLSTNPGTEGTDHNILLYSDGTDNENLIEQLRAGMQVN